MGKVHYITTDDDIQTVEADPATAPDWDEISEFLGGNPEPVWVWPGKKRHLMYVNETGACDNLPLNIYATCLYHECTKYQRGLKGPGDEPHVTCVEDLTILDPLDDVPWIHGNAIFLEGFDWRVL